MSYSTKTIPSFDKELKKLVKNILLSNKSFCHLLNLYVKFPAKEQVSATNAIRLELPYNQAKENLVERESFPI